MRLIADHSIPPRCMMSTITPQLTNMITEEENKRQYESYITSAITCGALDAIVSYDEWLATIRRYTPLKDNSVLRLSEKDAEKFVEMCENPPKPSEELRRLLRND